MRLTCVPLDVPKEDGASNEAPPQQAGDPPAGSSQPQQLHKIGLFEYIQKNVETTYDNPTVATPAKD